MKLIIGILLGALAVIFAAQNTETVSYSFLAWEVTAPRALIIVAVLLAGIIIGWLFTAIPRLLHKKK